jgi:hypothetical protein
MPLRVVSRSAFASPGELAGEIGRNAAAFASTDARFSAIADARAAEDSARSTEARALAKTAHDGAGEGAHDTARPHSDCDALGAAAVGVAEAQRS